MNKNPEYELLFEILHTREDGSETLVTLPLMEVLALLQEKKLAFASDLPIDEVEILKLATILGAEPNSEFNLAVHQVVIEPVLMNLRGWHSLRGARKFF
jgi:hypothetical protein